MTPLTIRIYEFEEAELERLAEENPAVSRNRAGRVALRLGLRVLGQEPGWLDRELRTMGEESRERRRHRAHEGGAR